MFNTPKVQRTLSILEQETDIITWVEAFLIDRKVSGASAGTIVFYSAKIKVFTDYCDSQVITKITEITPNIIRQYLLYLEDKGHNPGGIQAFYRTIRTFLYWWEQEVEPEDWQNPIKRVKAPKIPVQVLNPVDLDTVKALIDICDRKSFFGIRDKAIILCLLDTGARAQEFLDIDLEDINQISGEILIRRGKGGKPRTVYLGRKSRKAVRKYLKFRIDSDNALWVTREGVRLTYSGLRGIVKRRSNQAGVENPSLHEFRRAFALNMLRVGADIFSIQRLMGHADISILRRYLDQTKEDIQLAHRRAGPVDNAGL